MRSGSSRGNESNPRAPAGLCSPRAVAGHPGLSGTLSSMTSRAACALSPDRRSAVLIRTKLLKHRGAPLLESTSLPEAIVQDLGGTCPRKYIRTVDDLDVNQSDRIHGWHASCAFSGRKAKSNPNASSAALRAEASFGARTMINPRRELASQFGSSRSIGVRPPDWHYALRPEEWHLLHPALSHRLKTEGTKSRWIRRPLLEGAAQTELERRHGSTPSECVGFLARGLAAPRIALARLLEVHGQVCKRLRRRMKELSVAGICRDRKQLDNPSQEWTVLERTNPHHDFCVLPRQEHLRSAGASRPARYCSARPKTSGKRGSGRPGCASGEEPYTLKILLDPGSSECFSLVLAPRSSPPMSTKLC